MKNITNEILTPEIVESIKKEEGKYNYITFNSLSQKQSESIPKIIKTFSRLGSDAPEKLQERYDTRMSQLSSKRLIKYIDKMNHELINNYSIDKKFLEIKEEVIWWANTDFIILKKLYNRAGWNVQIKQGYSTGIDGGIDFSIVLAPRKKEFRTKENEKIRNLPYKYNPDIKGNFSWKLRDFYRND